jgi:hypothetical protein
MEAIPVGDSFGSVKGRRHGIPAEWLLFDLIHGIYSSG